MSGSPSSRLDRWLPRAARGDPEAERAARLVTISALAAALFASILSASRFALQGPGSPVGLALALSIPGFLAAPLVMRLAQSQRLGATLVPLSGLACLLGMALLEEGLRSEALYWVPFVPLVAALVLGGSGALAFGLLCALGTGLLAALHQTGFGFAGPPLEGRPLLLHLAAAANAPLFGAFLGWLYERDRQRAARALEDSRQRNAALLAALPDAILRVGADGRIGDLELPAGARSPITVEELLGRRVDEIFPEPIARQALDQVHAVLATGRLKTREYQLQFDGMRTDIELRAVPHGDHEVIGIVRDVTERKRLDAMREDFVATVSHELRTPLTSIHGSLRLIASGLLGELPDDVKEMAEIASLNSDRLRRLIDDLLDVGRLEAGKLELRIEPVELAEALRQSLSVNSGYADAHGVRLELLEPVPALEVEVDPDRLQQVMANLLSNAIKYSPEGERVSVGLERLDGRARITVSDRGEGIPQAFRSRIFDRFAQADSGTTRRGGGTGLGLAICKRLVEEFGGSIDFETSSPGEAGHAEAPGTRFRVDLPLRKLAADAPARA